MDHPDKAADVSVAGQGEIADNPDDVFDLAVENKQDEIVGYIEMWESSEWIYAETAATRWLERKRADEFDQR